MPVDFLQREGADIINLDHHHDNTMFGGINHVDMDASSTAEIVWRLAKVVGAELTEEIATALYVGPHHRHGQVHVREHRPGFAPHGGRADRGRRERRRDLPPPVRARADREGEARRPRDREHRPLRLRPPRPHLRLEGGLRGDRRLRAPHRGDHRQRPRARGHDRRRRDPRQARRRPRRPKGEPALLGRRRGRIGDRPRAGRGGHKRAAGFGTDMPYPEIVEFVRAEVAKQLD